MKIVVIGGTPATLAQNWTSTSAHSERQTRILERQASRAGSATLQLKT